MGDLSSSHILKKYIYIYTAAELKSHSALPVPHAHSAAQSNKDYTTWNESLHSQSFSSNALPKTADLYSAVSDRSENINSLLLHNHLAHDVTQEVSQWNRKWPGIFKNFFLLVRSYFYWKILKQNNSPARSTSCSHLWGHFLQCNFLPQGGQSVCLWGCILCLLHQ